MAEENAVIEAGAIETPLGQIVSTEMVMQLAERLKMLIPAEQQAKESWAEADFPMAVEVCLSRGLLPQSIGYEFYLMKVGGKIIIHRKYSQYLNWAQEKEPYRIIKRRIDASEVEGYKVGDFCVRAYLIRRSQEETYQQRYRSTLEALLGAGVDVDTALEKADSQAALAFPYHDGMVKREDVYGKSQQGKEYLKRGGAGDITGWKPGETRAEIRAIVGVVRQVYGEPSAQETRQRNLQKFGTDLPQLAAISMADQDEIVVDLKPEEREKYLQLLAANELQKQERRERDEGKGVELLKAERAARLAENDMRDNERQDAIGDDWREVFEVEDLPFDDAPPEETTEWPDDKLTEELLKYSYRDKRALHSASLGLFGKGMPDLSNIERLNWLEFAKRRDILLDKEMEMKDRLAKIPELKHLSEKAPVKALSEHLRDLMLDCVRRNTVLEGLND